jgi:8-amino-7-oxononanoate synthase
LNDLAEKGLSRTLSTYNNLIDFCSNDYLGLARSSEFQQRFVQAVQDLPAIGSTGSRLLTGNNQQIETLENKIAAFHKAEASLVFLSGYQANIALLSTIAGKHDHLIMDEFCHASLVDSARLSHSKRLRFKHNDLESLEQRLNLDAGNKFVVVESLYSMDGDLAPLPDIARLCEKYNAYLVVDEAHSAGVYGAGGIGLVHDLDLTESVFARIVTYGKAFGCQGGAVLGSSKLKQLLVNQARSFIFSTGVSLHQTAAINIAYELVAESDEARKNLRSLIQYFRDKTTQSSSNWLKSDSAIQGVVIPGNDAVVNKSNQLKEAGLLALPIRKPTVEEGKERIRICLHAFNTKQEIDRLVTEIEKS